MWLECSYAQRTRTRIIYWNENPRKKEDIFKVLRNSKKILQ